MPHGKCGHTLLNCQNPFRESCVALDLHTVVAHRVWFECNISIQFYRILVNQLCAGAGQIVVICSVWLVGSIDCYKNPFLFCSAFKNELMILNNYIPVCAVTEGITFLTDGNQ